jgi:hypothetical protein
MMTDPILTTGPGYRAGRWRGIRGCSCTCARGLGLESVSGRRRGSSRTTYVVASDWPASVGRGFRLTLTIYPSTTIHESAASEAVSP